MGDDGFPGVMGVLKGEGKMQSGQTRYRELCSIGFASAASEEKWIGYVIDSLGLRAWAC